MQLRETHRFEAPIERVWAMFHDPASHEAKFRALGHTNLKVVQVERTEQRLFIEIVRDVELPVPDIAKKFITPTQRLTSKDTWADHGDGTYGGSFELIGNSPAEIRGVTRIEADGDTTLYTITVDTKVKVPLVGGKIAEAFRGFAEQNLAAEFAAGDAWLAEH